MKTHHTQAPAAGGHNDGAMPDLPAGNSTTDFTALSRRSCLRHLAGLAPALAPVFALTPAAAHAQGSYPSRPVRIIVQFAAGGSSDILARTLGDGLSKRLGQPVIVENRSGAGGIIGTDYVVKSAADGYTLLLTVPGPIAANLVLYKKLPYDPRTDLRMVSDVVSPSMVMVVNPAVPAKDFKGLVEAVRQSLGEPDPFRLRYRALIFDTVAEVVRAAMNKQRAILAIIVVSYLMIVVDISIVITGLPRIRDGLGFSHAGLSWVQNAYTLTFGGLLLLGSPPPIPKKLTK